jgi:phosphoglycerol transferase MdoB-like AlkP superfamily enzyme
MGERLCGELQCPPARRSLALAMQKFLTTGSLLSSSKFGILALVGVALALAGLSWLLPQSLVIGSGCLPFVVYLLLICLLLHASSAIAVLTIALTIFVLANIANDSKISLTGLPITLIDIKFFLASPNESRSALKIGDAETLMILLPILAPTAFLIARAVGAAARPVTAERLRMLGMRVAAGCLIASTFLLFSLTYTRAVQMEFDHRVDHLWLPERVTAFSRELGLVGFVAFSYKLEHEQMPSAGLQGTSLHATSTAADVKGAIGKYAHPQNPPHDKLPNIVLVHVESTFDPDYVFSLSHRIRSGLFARNKYTQALGPLYVNTIGGGSWISEFEVLTGVDSRFFGYMGFYTHASLSPYVKNSFIHFLKLRGYQATAFYPVGGDFFNARNAFRKYGFDTFFDKGDLGLKAPGWLATDADIADAVVGKFSGAEPAPFVWYISLLENHSPHKCRNFGTEADFSVRFAAEASFLENCTLNEYVRVLSSTSRAFEKLRGFLESLETETARPFVLVGYGDHQPNSFTGTGVGAGQDFSRFRRVLDPKYTYFHLMSSVPDVVSCCDEAAPNITIIPSLVSAYAAASLDDLYLGANLYAFALCGRDPLETHSHIEAEALDRHAPTAIREEAVSRPCGVLPRLIDAYAGQGVFSPGLLEGRR